MRYLFIILLLAGCAKPDLNPLQRALRSSHPAMLNVLHDVKGYQIQILYSEIDSLPDGSVMFTDHEFRVDDEQYFYPASTVKFPAAVLAMEWADSHDSIDIDTPYTLARDTLIHSLDDDVRQIFAVSDNEANNRLYELLGRDHMNDRLRSMGIGPVRIAHRLSTANADRSNRDTLYFTTPYDTLKISAEADGPIEPVSVAGLQKGRGFMRDGSVVPSPMDFSQKNYFPLRSQHELTKRILFPQAFEADQLPALTAETRARLLEHMYKLPRESGYDPAEFYDSYVKFFLYGDSKEPIPEGIRIYSKVGYAYGTLTETAYIEDSNAGIGFLLSATILVNANGVFNDDQYEYETIGIPFLAQLGRELYMYERSVK